MLTHGFWQRCRDTLLQFSRTRQSDCVSSLRSASGRVPNREARKPSSARVHFRDLYISVGIPVAKLAGVRAAAVAKTTVRRVALVNLIVCRFDVICDEVEGVEAASYRQCHAEFRHGVDLFGVQAGDVFLR